MASAPPHRHLWIAFTLLLLITPMAGARLHQPTAIDALQYKQQLALPIDTANASAANQPIDIRVTFTNPCWAVNDTLNSIRIAADDGTGPQELDSQVYDLHHTDDTHASAASLVFLIPGTTTSKTKFYVLYNPTETPPADYSRHITVEDTHYFYEPIPGQTIDFDYYGIRQDGYVVYTIVQKGQLLGNPIALAAIKFKPNSTAVETFNLDQLADFDLRYGVPGNPDYSGTAFATDIKKTILVTGTLMARVRLACTSPAGDIASDNIYTYYYSPTTTKRITVDAHHTILKPITIPDPALQDGEYAGIVSIKARSASIEKMNVGDILPSLSVYTADGTIENYTVPTSPQSTTPEIVLSPQDDINLGPQAWVSLQDTATGKTHSIIFSATTGITNGTEDGIQVRSWAKQNVKLPGLEADTGSLILTRKTYQNGNHLTTIDQGKTYHYKTEFLTIEHADTTRISEESAAYQHLIQAVPIFRGNATAAQKTARYNLTVTVRHARSVPLGSLLSAALGKNLSYIYSELYQQETFRSSGTVGRLSLGAISLNFSGTNLRQKIQMILGIFDFKNSSLTKKIRYPNLDPGTYVVKIYRENPRFAQEHQYIGLAVVNLTQDTTIRIRCRSQGTITICLKDQTNTPVPNAHCTLTLDDATIAEAVTDQNGTARLTAPCSLLKPYRLALNYRGFQIGTKTIRLTTLRHFIAMKTSFTLQRYRLSLTTTDTWGFPPAVDLNPALTSGDMTQPTAIHATTITAGAYQFTDIPSAPYRLSLSYKTFKVDHNLTIDKDTTLAIVFPAEFPINLTFYDSYANRLSHGSISIQRQEKTNTTEITPDGTATISLPPGDYELLVQSGQETIAQQQVQVRGEKSLDLVTTQGSTLHTLLTVLGLAVAIGALVFFLWKRQPNPTLKIAAVGLLIIALASPWWVLTGQTGVVSTTTNTLVIPPQIVTMTKATNAIGGEISAVPAEVTMVLGLLSLLVGIACVLLIISLVTSLRLRKTTLIFSILSVIVILMILGVFYYAFSQVTQVGVGSFMGSGTLDVSLPGGTEQVKVPCSWGPGLGFCLIIAAAVLALLAIFARRIQGRLTRKAEAPKDTVLEQ